VETVRSEAFDATAFGRRCQREDMIPNGFP
jgi:hypothetical protein